MGEQQEIQEHQLLYQLPWAGYLQGEESILNKSLESFQAALLTVNIWHNSLKYQEARQTFVV